MGGLGIQTAVRTAPFPTSTGPPTASRLVGFSLGGISSLLATDSKNAASRDGGVAGVVAYYPLCYDGVDPSVRTLVLIGEKDDWTPAAKCQAVTGKANFEVVVFPGATHVFNIPFKKPIDLLGHHFVCAKAC